VGINFPPNTPFKGKSAVLACVYAKKNEKSDKFAGKRPVHGILNRARRAKVPLLMTRKEHGRRPHAKTQSRQGYKNEELGIMNEELGLSS